MLADPNQIPGFSHAQMQHDNQEPEEEEDDTSKDGDPRQEPEYWMDR